MTFDHEHFQKLAQKITPENWQLQYTAKSAHIIGADKDFICTPNHPNTKSIGSAQLSEREHEEDINNMKFIVACVNYVKNLLEKKTYQLTDQMIQAGVDAMRTDNVKDASEQGRIRRIWTVMHEIQSEQIKC